MDYTAKRPTLVVKARMYEQGRLKANQVWAFPTPVHESDLFDRAYLVWPDALVQLQDNMFLMPNRFGSWVD